MLLIFYITREHLLYKIIVHLYFSAAKDSTRHVIAYRIDNRTFRSFLLKYCNWRSPEVLKSNSRMWWSVREDMKEKLNIGSNRYDSITFVHLVCLLKLKVPRRLRCYSPLVLKQLKFALSVTSRNLGIFP